MKTLIVIPARYGSTRFPGKPLQRIAGHTLLERVVHIAQQASTATGATYVVATDHPAIQEYCATINAPCVMTDTNLRTGSDRALAAALAQPETPEIIVNLQGDAPFTPPAHVVKLINAFATYNTDVVTPVVNLTWEELETLRQRKTVTPFSGTTCVMDNTGRALWFSKQILPAIRNEDKIRASSPMSPVYRHIGLYAYRTESLQKFQQLPEGVYEKLEGLEQLRFMENGMTIHAVTVEKPTISMSGIDTPEDAELATTLIAKHGDPFNQQ